MSDDSSPPSWGKDLATRLVDALIQMLFSSPLLREFRAQAIAMFLDEIAAIERRILAERRLPD
jgi:RimJ/RimL family protein N-acetyltransferase